MATLFDLTKIVELEIGDNCQKCMKFMIAFIQIINESIPNIGIKALDVAKRYWLENKVDSTLLEKARVDCWQYLDDHKASTNFQEPKFCALRAVICILYSEPPEDIGEVIQFYFEMIHTVINDNEILENEVNRLLTRTKDGVRRSQ